MFDFPANPVNGSQYTTPNGITFVYNGYAWIMKTGPWGSYGISLLDHGPGIVIVPDPITDTGTVSLEIPVSVANGGTGATNQANARTNLGAVNIAGDTMLGSLNISTANPTVNLTKTASGGQSAIYGTTGANLRWVVTFGDAGPESGGNSGSNYAIHRYADNGAWLGSPFSISRATGSATFTNDLTVSGQLVASGGTTFNSIITMPNATYIRWRDTGGTPIELLSLWSDNQFYVGSYGTHPLVLRGGSIQMNGQVTGNGEIRATTALRCLGDPNAIITFTQRDNYGIAWGFYATGNTSRWWNNQYGDRLTLDIGGTLYFTNNVVVPNNCYYYSRAADGTPYNVIGISNGNVNYVGHPSFNMTLQGASTRSSGNFSAPNVSADTEVYAARSCAAGSYLWVNGIQLSNNGGNFYSGSPFQTPRVITDRIDIYGGVFYNGYNNGWLYFNGSLRVADFYSENNVSAAGKLYMANGHYLQYWNGYTDTGQPFHSGSNIVAEGSLTSNNGLVYLAGMYWQNNAGWMFCPWQVRSDGDIQSGATMRCTGIVINGMSLYNDGGGFLRSNYNLCSSGNVKGDNDVICWNGVFRSGYRKGGRFECPGWDYDWLSPFCSEGYLYCTPDYSGGPYFANAGWWSDSRLKRNIRDSEVDALGKILAIKIRAYDWLEEGINLLGAHWLDREVHIGMIAQELEEHIPVAVKECAWEHKTKFIDGTFFHPYYVRAIQQLAEQNAKLEARIAQLEARLDRVQ